MTKRLRPTKLSSLATCRTHHKQQTTERSSSSAGKRSRFSSAFCFSELSSSRGRAYKLNFPSDNLNSLIQLRESNVKLTGIIAVFWASIYFAPVAYAQSTPAPVPEFKRHLKATPTPSQQDPYIANAHCHKLLGSGPEAVLWNDQVAKAPYPRPTPLPDLHLVRAGKVVVFNKDNSVTVIREDGATSIGAANKCEKSDITLGQYTAARFVEIASYVKTVSGMPEKTKREMNSWLLQYFDACSKIYPDVEALRPMLADIRTYSADISNKPGKPAATAK